MRVKFWHSDWFSGLIISLVVLTFTGSDFFQSIERELYDWGVRSSEQSPGNKIAVIAIDEQSISNLGRWPWSRDIHAEMINLLHQGGAKVVGETVFFLEPQLDPGLLYIDDLIQFYSTSSFQPIFQPVLEEPSQHATDEPAQAVNEKLAQAATEEPAQAVSEEIAQLHADINTLGIKLIEAKQALNTDLILANSMAAANNVVLAMPFIVGNPIGNPDQPLPDYVVANQLSTIDDRIGAVNQGFLPLPTVAGISPIEQLGTLASSIGHLNATADVDGGIRTEPLVLKYYDMLFPSLSLQIAASSLNLGVNDIKVNLGEGVELGGLSIRTNPNLEMYTFFYNDRDGQSAFQVDSFYDVISGRIPVEKYKDKIVLVGATAAGVGTTQVTPINPAMPPVLTLAHSVASIMNEHFFITPEWGVWARLGAFLLVFIYIVALVPRLKASLSFIVGIVILLGLIISHYVLMTSHGTWVLLATPGMMLIIGYLLLTTKRYLVTERGKMVSDSESAESNRMLGLAFQGQGQLDMAFEKFRKCPLDNAVMDPLYNLALDFERKRQFNKAGSVYEYIAKHDANFKDVKKRMDRSKQLDETIMLGGAGSSTAGGTLILDSGTLEKPMLGRYEVEKELGKGAMGVVYLGKDPKIGRVVAIKTMALAQEFEDDELEEVKERFFREAETAGRLSHPNIVTIFDAGEEHDLAYIAMAFLKGSDLAKYTKPGALLPLATVLDIISKCADGLHYAHGLNVVHRDIKPANIMYDPESQETKITDFGIARITDSSKTKTGMVLGTPSYMSPEQLAGKKVDGRSDLFSLGVMLYQMACGKLPFKADSMAALMFQITNEEHTPLTEMQPDIPACVSAIVDKTLTKDAEQRYQTGAEIVAAINACRQQL
ncbi:MAG: CHASE2 domain-containing protein [Gammaproteobacteria bacterium]|nr:CHASE2 domain-containing protein [Gammaproteobacteria bacterium]